jgi:hypothetical protein
MPRRLLDPTEEHLAEWSDFREELIERTAALRHGAEAWVKVFSLRPGRPAEALVSNDRGELRVVLGVAARKVDPPAFDLLMLEDQWTPRGPRRGMLRYEAAWEADDITAVTVTEPTTLRQRLRAFLGRSPDTALLPHVSRADISEAIDSVLRTLRLHLDHGHRRDVSWHIAGRTPEWARDLSRQRA